MIGALGVIAFQSWIYLKQGMWYSLSILDGIVIATGRYPDLSEWLGLQSILIMVPIWAALMVISIVIIVIGLVLVSRA